MNPGRVVVFFAWLFPADGVTGAHEGTIQHLRQSKADEFLECARGKFGKPVFASAHAHRLGRELICTADSDRAALTTGLLNLEPGMRTFDAGEYIYLVARYYFEDKQRPLSWNEVAIDTAVARWGTKRESRQLTDAELAEIKDLVVSQVRTTPLLPSARPKTGEPARLEVHLLLDAPSLRRKVESLVGVYGQADAVQRLVYGEYGDGKVRIKWDSPLFYGDDVRMAYADVNGDGVKEILLNSRHGRDGEMLSIFDVKGEELTRQEKVGDDCAAGSGGLYSDEGGVCPLHGNSVDLVPAQAGKGFDLLVTLGEKETLYSLSGNRYVASTP